MASMVLVWVRSHKGIELHFGGHCSSDGHKREEICFSWVTLNKSLTLGEFYFVVRKMRIKVPIL